MTDETPKKRTRRPRPVPPDDAPRQPAPGGAPDDPDDALRRLESMGSGQPAATPPQSYQPDDPLPPQPAVDSFGTPASPRSQRPMGSSRKISKARPKPAGSNSSRMIARIAAPVAFLVAVIAFVGIVVNSGVMDGSSEPVVTPTAKASKATNGGAKTTRKYVVKSGDSLSSIAVRFNTSTAELQDLNPDLSGTTLVVGQRIVVPAQ